MRIFWCQEEIAARAGRLLISFPGLAGALFALRISTFFLRKAYAFGGRVRIHEQPRSLPEYEPIPPWNRSEPALPLSAFAPCSPKPEGTFSPRENCY